MKKCGIPEKDDVVVKYRFKTVDPETEKFKELEERIEALEAAIDDGLTERLSKLESLYGVGSIWITLENENPGDLFGGTWEKIEDRFILASGLNAAGATGGSNAVRQIELTIDQLPPHTHHENEAVMVGSDYLGNLAFPSSGNKMTTIGYADSQYDGDPDHYYDLGNTSNQNDETGTPVDDDYVPSDVEIDIVPAYLAVNVWKRTA